MKRFHGWAPRLCCVLLATACLLPVATARGDDILFDIKDVAAIDADRPLPKFTVEQVADHSRDDQRGDRKGQQDYNVIWRLANGQSVTVGPYVEWPQKFGAREGTGSSGIDRRSVVAGWLKGAKDLLVIAAAADSWPGGTGHYVNRTYLIVRLAEGKPSVLLTRVALVGGATRHVRASGLTSIYYAFDPKTRLLKETFHHDTWPCSKERQPLFHPVNKGGEPLYVADIQERVVHKMAYRNGKLTSQAIMLYYKVQPRDTIKDITVHYFGPYAPSGVLFKANPKLKVVKSGEYGYPPAGSEVRIPLPEPWLRRAFLRLNTPHNSP